MSPLQGAAPTSSAANEWDKEIEDVASYVHNYNIDSDLAVSVVTLKGLKDP